MTNFRERERAFLKSGDFRDGALGRLSLTDRPQERERETERERERERERNREFLKNGNFHNQGAERIANHKKSHQT